MLLYGYQLIECNWVDCFWRKILEMEIIIYKNRKISELFYLEILFN